MFSVDFNRQCTKCSIINNDIVIHWLCHCPANETLRYAVCDSFVASKGYSAYIDTMFKSPLFRCVNFPDTRNWNWGWSDEKLWHSNAYMQNVLSLVHFLTWVFLFMFRFSEYPGSLVYMYLWHVSSHMVTLLWY